MDGVIDIILHNILDGVMDFRDKTRAEHNVNLLLRVWKQLIPYNGSISFAEIHMKKNDPVYNMIHDVVFAWIDKKLGFVDKLWIPQDVTHEYLQSMIEGESTDRCFMYNIPAGVKRCIALYCLSHRERSC